MNRLPDAKKPIKLELDTTIRGELMLANGRWRTYAAQHSDMQRIPLGFGHLYEYYMLWDDGSEPCMLFRVKKEKQ